MPFNATPEQKKAIDANGSIIVSAAAGSGKTAVLVERVARLLTDKSNPLPADKILIVTFTNAAAAELRTRIDKRLSEEFRLNPDSTYLQRQRILLSSAKICTIDSFCIDFLKENFESCQINPSFKIAENATINTITKAALSFVINECFDNNDKEFLELLSYLGDDYDDSKLQKCIFSLFNFSRHMPYPDLWLDKIVKDYENHAEGTDTKWFEDALAYVMALAQDAEIEFSQALKLLKTNPSAYEKYAENYNYFYELSYEILSLCYSKNWDGIYNLTEKLSPPKCKNLSADEKTETVVHSIQLRDQGKKTLEKICKSVYGKSSDLSDEVSFTLPFIRKIVALVKDFEARLYNELLRQNLMTFYMAEQYVLEALTEIVDGKIVKKESAQMFTDRFDAVLVDEYQDTNTLQDTLFAILSNNSKNLFCVGDMKQCIYKFRGANPMNFLLKKTSADSSRPLDSTDSTLRIDLSCNFRSRKEVCQHINAIFSKILYSQNSDFDYDESEKLTPMANYPDNADTKVEYHFVDYNTALAKSNNQFDSKLVAEAEAVADTILENMSKDAFLRDGESLRKPRFSDFTILVRSMRDKGDVYIKVLKERGIPVSAGTSDIIESDEVITLISFLKIINNPSDDIALVTLLTSPLFAFTMDEIAKIRIQHKYGNFISSLMTASERGDTKVSEFLNIILKLRNMSVMLSLELLIEEIFEETNLLNIFSSMDGGDVKRSNLLCVQNFAASFESDRRRTVREFVNYFSDLDNKDFSLSSDSGDSVTVMSIHKSKGLQFPICILANTSNQFNQQDLRDAFLISENYGFSAGYYNAEGEKIDNTVLRTVMKYEEHRQLLAEELRIFYVALTRAEEKLITFSTYDSIEKEVTAKLDRLQLTESNSRVEYSLFRKSVSYADWILEALLIDGKASAILSEETDSNIFVHTQIDIPVKLENKPEYVESNSDNVASLKDVFEYEYPYAPLISLEAKTSVTEMVHKADDKKYCFTKRPSFLQEMGLSSAERGTATHKVMQYIDFERGSVSVKDEIERLTEYMYLTEEEAAAVDVDAIHQFFRSELFKRIQNSSLVKREMRFITEFPATSLKPELDIRFADEAIIVQGAVDLVFSEDNKLIIVDFKTDRNKDENDLINAYGEQLKYYKKACEKILGNTSSELYIYSFSLGKSIPVK